MLDLKRFIVWVLKSSRQSAYCFWSYVPYLFFYWFLVADTVQRPLLLSTMKFSHNATFMVLHIFTLSSEFQSLSTIQSLVQYINPAAKVKNVEDFTSHIFV